MRRSRKPARSTHKSPALFCPVSSPVTAALLVSCFHFPALCFSMLPAPSLVLCPSCSPSLFASPATGCASMLRGQPPTCVSTELHLRVNSKWQPGVQATAGGICAAAFVAFVAAAPLVSRWQDLRRVLRASGGCVRRVVGSGRTSLHLREPSNLGKSLFRPISTSVPPSPPHHRLANR